MRKLIVLIVFLAFIYGGYHYFMGAGGTPGMMGFGGPAPVGVAKVVEDEVILWDEFPGKLMAVDSVQIRPRVGGTIDAIHFQEGQMVEKDQLLFTIDPKPYETALQSAKAIASYTEGERVRAAKLLPAKTISQSEFDLKKNAAEVAASNLVKAELDLGYTQIKSPIAGRISRAEITVGNLVNAGGEAPILTSVVSLDPIYADVDVDEQSFVRYLKAHNGNADALKDVPVKLALSGQDEFAYEGRITSFDNQMNTSAGTVRMRAMFDNKGGALIPGLYAKLRVGGTGKQNLLLINDTAIGTDQNKKFVYVVGEGNKVQYRVITLGPLIGGLRAVQDGLKPDDKIVVSGVQRLRPDAEIIPEMVDMDKASGSGLPASGKSETEAQNPKPEAQP